MLTFACSAHIRAIICIRCSNTYYVQYIKVCTVCTVLIYKYDTVCNLSMQCACGFRLYLVCFTGEVIYHPSGGKGAARSISEIERVPQLQLSVNETMDFSATKVVSLALGPSESDGILNKELTFHYTCRQLFTGVSCFSLCI